jgi:peptidoglycan/LPS O-acetylase OafA/YrhL
MAIIAGFTLLWTASAQLGLSTPADSSLARGIFGFGLGSLITFFRHRYVMLLTGGKADLLIIAFAALILWVMGHFDDNAPALFLLPPVFALLIAVLVSTRHSRIIALLEIGLLRKFGQFSFSIYMNHAFILVLFGFIAGQLATGLKIPALHGVLHAIPLWAGDLLVLGYVTVLLTSSWATYRWIENPGRALGRRLSSGMKSL